MISRTNGPKIRPGANRQSTRISRMRNTTSPTTMARMRSMKRTIPRTHGQSRLRMTSGIPSRARMTSGIPRSGTQSRIPIETTRSGNPQAQSRGNPTPIGRSRVLLPIPVAGPPKIPRNGTPRAPGRRTVGRKALIRPKMAGPKSTVMVMRPRPAIPPLAPAVFRRSPGLLRARSARLSEADAGVTVAKGRVGAEKMAPEEKMEKIQRKEVARARVPRRAKARGDPRANPSRPSARPRGARPPK
mmetsp:Transcript_43990/g.69939  ORF Transcript_43990/g.69939 Transcript_43990/m.69939 type:complete len:244 (-) Transcript_43990:249-980(-)